MRLRACPREAEIAELLKQGHWPQASAPELRAHADTCAACRQRVVLTQVFSRERAKAAGEARLEAPGVLWWRAQLRKRNAALERIGRPILGAQVFAVAVALVAAGMFFASQARRGTGWFAWIADIPRALHFQSLLPAALENVPAGTWVLAGLLLAVLAVIGGAAAYAASDKR